MPADWSDISSSEVIFTKYSDMKLQKETAN